MGDGENWHAGVFGFSVDGMTQQAIGISLHLHTEDW
jgi:hypothetical protein